MNIIRVHHRSRKRIMIANVLTMMVIGPFAFGIASLWNFQGPAMWIACILFIANMALFAWTTWNVARQRRDFVCLLTADRVTCQSPDEALAPSFDISLREIAKLEEADQSDGRPRCTILTRSGETATLTYNFGNPASLFFKDIQRLQPSIQVEKS
jgi:hypothetical protein